MPTPSPSRVLSKVAGVSDTRFTTMQPPRKRPHFHSKKPAAKRPFAKKNSGSGEKGWDQVAGWYDKLVGDGGSDYHRHVILPAAIRMLAPAPGEKILDVCCGQGVLIPLVLDAKVAAVTAVDASPKLIASAKTRFSAETKGYLSTSPMPQRQDPGRTDRTTRRPA